MRVADSTKRFQLESEMVGSARSWLSRLGLMVKEEFYTPWGTCDLVGVSFDKNRVRQRLHLGQREPMGPIPRIALLNRIPDTRTGTYTTLQRLERQFQVVFTRSEILQQIDRLIEAKFVRERKPGCFEKLNGWAPLHKRIVTLELKLNRISEAISQAASHLRFATDSYVGLPTATARGLLDRRHLEQFLGLGIGIVAVGRRTCAALLPARSQTRHNNIHQIHCVERFWRDWIKDN